MMTDLG